MATAVPWPRIRLAGFAIDRRRVVAAAIHDLPRHPESFVWLDVLADPRLVATGSRGFRWLLPCAVGGRGTRVGLGVRPEQVHKAVAQPRTHNHPSVSQEQLLSPEGIQ